VTILKTAGQLGAVALVLALLGLLGWKLFSDEGPAAKVGGPVPAFDLPALDGDGRIVVDGRSGRPLVVNFWASWCGPCRDEAPILEAAWRKYRDRVDFVGVDTRDFTGDARAFVRRFGLTFPMAYDGPAALWDIWGIDALPETFVVDASGTIVAHTTVIETTEELEALIERTLS
jgi:cytochrome c biogenesis protein CcmG, thiol:disulfide interchange protein DsbE